MERINEPFYTPPLSSEKIAQVDDALIAAGFGPKRTRPKNLIVSALANAIDYQEVPYKPYTFQQLTRDSFGAARSAGPHQKELARLLLIHSLFLAWRMSFDKKPTISRKITAKDPKTIRSPFVVFAQSILALAGIGKVEDNLAIYKSYAAATHAGLTYEAWRQSKNAKNSPKMARKKTVRRGITQS
jgi:hypothetical protein